MCNCNSTDQQDFSWQMSSSFLKWVCHFVESTLNLHFQNLKGIMTTGWERIAGWVSYVVGDARRVRFWYDILCVLFENCSLKKLNLNYCNGKSSVCILLFRVFKWRVTYSWNQVSMSFQWFFFFFDNTHAYNNTPTPMVGYWGKLILCWMTYTPIFQVVWAQIACSEGLEPLLSWRSTLFRKSWEVPWQVISLKEHLMH